MQSVQSRLSKSPGKRNYTNKLGMPANNMSAQTSKTKAYSNANEHSYMDISNISPGPTQHEMSMRMPKTVKSKKKSKPTSSNFSSLEKPRETY